MDWVIVSIVSAAAFGVVSVLDKVILMRYTPSAHSFIVITGLLQLPGAIVVILVAPLESIPAGAWLTAFLSGFLWGTSLVVMFWVMNRRDVSQVIPVISTSPVFVAILSVFFLDETLSALHWIAILVTVGGAALISLRSAGQTSRFVLDAAFYLLFFGSLLVAGGQFLSKLALEDMNLWNLLVIRTLGLSSACVLLMARPSLLRELRQVLSSRRGAGLFVLNEGGIAFVATVLTLWGIMLGPVALAVTLMSTRPLFVFVFSVAMSAAFWRLLDEPLDRATLARKLVSTAMITGGISAISLL